MVRLVQGVPTRLSAALRSFSLRAVVTSRTGFTLIEVFIVTVMLGALAAMAATPLQSARRSAEIARAVGDIKALETDLYSFEVEHQRFPTSLAEIGRSQLLDPWGNPYHYLRIKGAGGKNGKVQGARKDRFLVPINSDFDLYSVGANGTTVAPLTAAQSADDVVRANNGGFVGLAVEY